jgi:hypothetical protein
MWHPEMSIQISLTGPILIEYKYTWICRINVEIVIDTACLGAGWGHLGLQQGGKFGASFWVRRYRSNQSIHIKPFSG